MADAKTPIVRQMSVAPTTSAPSQSTGNSGPSGSGGSEHTKTPQVRPIFSWKPTFENGLHILMLLQHFNGLAQEVHEVQNVALKMFKNISSVVEF